MVRAVLPGSLPSRAAAFVVEEYRRRIQEVVAGWRPQIVQAEYAIMAPYLSDVRPTEVCRVLVQHDSQSLLAREIAARRRGPSGFVARREAASWDRLERRAARHIDAVVTLSERDAALLRPTPASRIVTIPPVVPLPSRAANAVGASPPRLLFVGMFLHLPNIDAAERLVDSILPRVRASFPSASLDLVGSHLPEQLRRRAGEGVSVAEDVPDVRAYLERAAVVTAPIRLGSGVRVKVLEALAAGKAIVASPRAVEGIDIVDGEHLLVANDDAAFAAAIVDLLRRPERRAALAAAARAWAELHLDSDRDLQAYADLYDTLLGIESGEHR